MVATPRAKGLLPDLANFVDHRHQHPTIFLGSGEDLIGRSHPDPVRSDDSLGQPVAAAAR